MLDAHSIDATAAKAECFGECFGTPNNRTSVSRSYCKKNCTINGDDESAATDPSTGAASTMETAAGVALASMVAGVFMML